MGERISVDPEKLHATLKNTVFKGANDEELLTLVAVANQYDLNPLVRQIYAFPQKGGGIVPVVGIDGWLKIVNEHPQFDGMECLEIEDSGNLLAVECIIHRKDRKHPIKVREYLSECIRKSEPWNQMPRRMLRHKAIMQCARVAFSICGIHDEDDAKDIERNVRGRVVEDGGEDDPMTTGLAALTKKKAEPQPENLTLNNDLSLDEKLWARARAVGVSIEALLKEAQESGICKSAKLDDLTNAEKESILA